MAHSKDKAQLSADPVNGTETHTAPKWKKLLPPTEASSNKRDVLETNRSKAFPVGMASMVTV